jgi:hypothetical protein
MVSPLCADICRKGTQLPLAFSHTFRSGAGVVRSAHSGLCTSSAISYPAVDAVGGTANANVALAQSLEVEPDDVVATT